MLRWTLESGDWFANEAVKEKPDKAGSSPASHLSPGKKREKKRKKKRKKKKCFALKVKSTEDAAKSRWKDLLMILYLISCSFQRKTGWKCKALCLWARITRNPGVSTHPFACSLALLTHSLAPTSALLASLTRSAHSLANSLTPESERFDVSNRPGFAPQCALSFSYLWTAVSSN